MYGAKKFFAASMLPPTPTYVSNPAGYKIISSENTPVTGVFGSREPVKTRRVALHDFAKNALKRTSKTKTKYTNKRDKLFFNFDDGFVYGDCSSLVEAMLAVVAPNALSEVRAHAGLATGKRLLAAHFAEFFSGIGLPLNQPRYWAQISDFRDASRGDVLAVKYLQTDGKKTSGHVMILDGPPLTTLATGIVEGLTGGFGRPTSTPFTVTFKVIHEAGKEGTGPGFSRKTKMAKLNRFGEIVSIKNSTKLMDPYKKYELIAIGRLRN